MFNYLPVVMRYICSNGRRYHMPDGNLACYRVVAHATSKQCNYGSVVE